MSRTILITVLLIAHAALFAQRLDPMKEALRAEQWLRANRVVKPEGVVWPVVPGDTTVVTNLYSGTGGIVLFYLELYRATKNESFLAEARSGADYIMAMADHSKPSFDDVGLYTGEAGNQFVFNRVFEVTGFKKYREAATRSYHRLSEAVKITGDQADWRYNDIVYGGAGIGLMLLQMENRQGLPLAVQTGRGLLAHSLPAEGGNKWYMDTAMVKRNYYMPNFSHGTAGVGYFLARLYQETGHQEFLDGALNAANHLKAISNPDAWVYHHDAEDGKDLYYLSWCHGPAGTARLYYQLYQVTKDESWKELISRSAAAMMKCGIPEKRLPGYWDNVSVCCGSASVASFYLDLYQTFGNKEYLDFAYTMTADVLKRTERDGEGIKWTQAEHRRRPELLQAQTGMMQGAAGIGLWLLRLNAFEKKGKRLVRMPDDPFE
jgi:lantibiotic modifying enzyme